MSQTTIDSYLADSVMPSSNKLVVDPEYHNMRFTTPVGRFPYIHVAKPHSFRQKNGTMSDPKWGATLLLAPGTETNPILVDIWKAVCMVADAHWPAIDRVDPQNPNNIIKVPGSHMFSVPENLGGFHFPIRRGDESYEKEPSKFGEWRGLWFINTSMMPKTKSGVEQRPVCLNERGDEEDPLKFYAGCYGRMNVTIAPFEQMGNKGVTFYLNVVQFAKHGEKMSSGFDSVAAGKAAMAEAGALPVAEPQAPAGGFAISFGPNSMTPGAVPPGAPMHGFAAPPPQQQAPTQSQGGFIPPQQGQPWQPATGGAGARPPGV